MPLERKRLGCLSWSALKNSRTHMIKKTSLLATLLCPLLAMAEEPEHKPKTPFIEYHNRMMVFTGFHQCYERIKTNALYAGIDAWVAPTTNGHGLWEAEFRMGYNLFYNGRDHFTPIAGVGYVQDIETEEQWAYVLDNGNWVETHHSEHHKPGIAYGTIGFLYDHEFNTVFNLGLRLKGLIGGPVSTEHFDWGSPVGGFDASLPITFRFGRKRHWEYRLEPFDVLLYGSEAHRNYFGFRGGFAYRF